MVLDEDVSVILQSADGHGKSYLNSNTKTLRDDDDEEYECNDSSLGKFHE